MNLAKPHADVLAAHHRARRRLRLPKRCDDYVSKAVQGYAVHEAAHAVAFHEMGQPFKFVTVIPHKQNGGDVTLTPEQHAAFCKLRRLLQARAILAAHTAQLYMDPDHNFNMRDSDVRHVARLFGGKIPPHVSASVAQYVVKPVVWSKIERVARWLLRRGTLYPDDVARLCKG